MDELARARVADSKFRILLHDANLPEEFHEGHVGAEIASCVEDAPFRPRFLPQSGGAEVVQLESNNRYKLRSASDASNLQSPNDLDALRGERLGVGSGV